MYINVRMKRDKDKFCHDGYFYIFDRVSADKSRKFHGIHLRFVHHVS